MTSPVSLFLFLFLSSLLLPSILAGRGNPYDTPQNATDDDSDLTQFIQPILEPLNIKLTRGLMKVGPTHAASLNTGSYDRYKIRGTGTFWRTVSNVDGIWIDLRTSSGYTDEQYHKMGIIYNRQQQTLIYNITYQNQLLDTFDLLHIHGQNPHDWHQNGVPLMTALPLAPGEIRTCTYEVDVTNQIGTSYVHSMWGYNRMLGMHIPFIIQLDITLPTYIGMTNTSTPIPIDLKQILNDPTTVDVLFYLEDWCLQQSDNDDAVNDADYDSKLYREPAVCQNPMLAFRGMWGEWNEYKRYIQTETLDARANGVPFSKCEDPVKASEFTFSYFFANGRTFDDAYMIRLKNITNINDQTTKSIHLRIINVGSLTSFRIQIPSLYQQVFIVAVDGNLISPIDITPKPFNLFNPPPEVYVWIAVGQRIDIVANLVPNKHYTMYALQEAPSTEDIALNSTRTFLSAITGILLYTTDTPAITYLETEKPTGMLSQHREWLEKQERSFHAYPSTGLTWSPSEATRNFTLDLNGYNGIRGINGQGWQRPPIGDTYYRNPYAIHVKPNDQVCLIVKNWDQEVQTLHLHGHRFQVREYDGIEYYGAMRDTIQIPASCGTVTICFDANADPHSIHSLHSSSSIHELSGLHTTIEYANYTPIVIPYQYTWDVTEYNEKFKHKAQVNNGPSQVINNIYQSTKIVDAERITGLGVGLTLGLALLISWLCFGLVYCRIRSTKRYSIHEPHRGSLSQAAGGGAGGGLGGTPRLNKLPSHNEGIELHDEPSQDVAVAVGS